MKKSDEESSTPFDDETMALPYAEVIAQDRVERWEAGARIASTTTATGDEYKLAKSYLELLSKQSESASSGSLLPCPFCGSAPKLHPAVDDSGHQPVECETEDCPMSRLWPDLRSWQKRAGVQSAREASDG